MPHVNIKLWPGRSDKQKAELAAEVTKAMMKAIGASDDSISVAIEDVPSGQWMEKVYNPEIRDRPATIFKKPGYSPF